MLESVPYRGIKLASDESMLPQSQRGFAPVVRGIAQSNAMVTIRQNNSVIYQTSVPPVNLKYQISIPPLIVVIYK